MSDLPFQRMGLDLLDRHIVPVKPYSADEPRNETGVECVAHDDWHRSEMVYVSTIFSTTRWNLLGGGWMSELVGSARRS